MADIRKFQILLSLLEAKETLSVDELRRQHQVSEKTIRTDLKTISEWLQKVGRNLRVVRKPGVGVYLEGDDLEKKLASQLVREHLDQQRSPYETVERKLRIFLLLLQLSHPITLEQLSTNFYISRSSLYSDLQTVEEWVVSHGLTLVRKPNYGLKIEGEERKRRLCMQQIVDQLLQGPWNIDLKELFPSIPFQSIKDSLRRAEKLLPYLLTGESFRHILIQIALMVGRIKRKKFVRLPPDELKELQASREFPVIEKFVKEIEKVCVLRIPKEEIAYLTIFFVGARSYRSDYLHKEWNTTVHSDQKAEAQAKELIDRVAKYLDVPIQEDRTLLLSLALHLHSSINRLRHQIAFPNPMLTQIKENYRAMFETMLEVVPTYGEEIGVSFSEDDIGYLTLHFQAALERLEQQEETRKVLLVCTTGIGTLQLLASRLKKQFPMIQIVNMIPRYELKEAIQEHQPELVISTTDLPKDLDVPGIVVSPIFSKEEQQLVSSMLDALKQNKRSYPVIQALLDERRIFLDVNLKRREDIIHFLWKVLYDQGFVTFNYKQKALDREKLSSTAIGEGIAIPHGPVEECLRSGIAIARLKEPILWGDEQVQLIILFACDPSKKHIMKGFFRELHQLLEDPERLENWKKEKDVKEFIQVVSSGRRKRT